MATTTPGLFINPADKSEMVLIEGGWYWVGSRASDRDASPNEQPGHVHSVKPFVLGIKCVTVAQFRFFINETGYENDGQWDSDPDDHPVRYVNWGDASAYAHWAGLRLPTEVEWEIGARGPGKLKYPWGNHWDGGNRLCWAGRKGPQGETTSVVNHPAGNSPLGTFQQSGNVWEWCQEWYQEAIYTRYAKKDFTLPATSDYRVIRGGSFKNFRPEYFRCAFRNACKPDSRNFQTGFRLAGTPIDNLLKRIQ